MSGRLRLRFVCEPVYGTTVLAVCEQEPPLRVVRPFPLVGGGALLHLHNLSGGVLGGDQLALDVEVAAGARVQMTTTGATRVYRCLPHVPPARQICAVRVGAAGLLEYVPDPLIPFAGSRYQQSTRIELEQDAGLFWWEILAPGRLAREECFAYDLLQSEMTILVDGLPIVCERFKLEPLRTNPGSPVRLGVFRYHASFYICRAGLPATRWGQLERELAEFARQRTRANECVWGVSALVAHGLLVRALSRDGSALASGLLAFWRLAKWVLYEEEVIPPRKMY